MREEGKVIVKDTAEFVQKVEHLLIRSNIALAGLLIIIYGKKTVCEFCFYEAKLVKNLIPEDTSSLYDRRDEIFEMASELFLDLNIISIIFNCRDLDARYKMRIARN
jgi:hypothetical protein